MGSQALRPAEPPVPEGSSRPPLYPSGRCAVVPRSAGAPLPQSCLARGSGRPMPASHLPASPAHQDPHKPLNPRLQSLSSGSRETRFTGPGRPIKQRCRVSMLRPPPPKPLSGSGCLCGYPRAGRERGQVPASPRKCYLSQGGGGKAKALEPDHPVLPRPGVPAPALTACNSIPNSQVQESRVSASEKWAPCHPSTAQVTPPPTVTGGTGSPGRTVASSPRSPAWLVTEWGQRRDPRRFGADDPSVGSRGHGAETVG